MSGAATIFGGSGAVFGTTTTGQPQQILSDSQALRTSLALQNVNPGDAIVKVASQILGGVNGDSLLPVAQTRWNGTSFELMDNNREVSLLASVVRTALAISPVQINKNGKGLVVYVSVTANPGDVAKTLSLRLISNDLVSQTAFDLWIPAAIPGDVNMLYKFLLYPGVNAATPGGFNAVIPLALPRTWWIAVLPSDNFPWTYSVSGSLIL